MKRITQYFLQGVLLVAPVAIIFYIIYSLFVSIDGLLVDKLELIVGFKIPGLGILVSFIFLTLLGFIGETALVKPFKKAFGKLLEKIPVLKLLYTSLNDLFSAFVGKEKKFNVPVKVLFNKENNLWKMGFITRETMDVIGNNDLAAVYFPHSYNFSGELYLVPSERIFKLDISPAEAMKFVVSGGVTHLEPETL
jgi:uncharacterized membrane protein